MPLTSAGEISSLGIGFSLVLLLFFQNNALILSGLYGLPLQSHNQLVFKFNSVKSKCGEGIKEFFISVLFIQKVTDTLSSNHHLSLYTKLMTVLNKEA